MSNRALERAACLIAAGAFGLVPLLASCTAEVPPSAEPDSPRIKRMMLKPHDTPPEPAVAPVAGDPFDRGAAAKAMAEVDVHACEGLGLTGEGHVTVTFATSGQTSRAIVDSGPFPGTPAGECLATQFKTASVPPFGGKPTRVGKSFTLK